MLDKKQPLDLEVNNYKEVEVLSKPTDVIQKSIVTENEKPKSNLLSLSENKINQNNITFGDINLFKKAEESKPTSVILTDVNKNKTLSPFSERKYELTSQKLTDKVEIKTATAFGSDIFDKLKEKHQDDIIIEDNNKNPFKTDLKNVNEKKDGRVYFIFIL